MENILIKCILTFIASLLKYWMKSFDYYINWLKIHENNQRIISSKIISRKFDNSIQYIDYKRKLLNDFKLSFQSKSQKYA